MVKAKEVGTLNSTLKDELDFKTRSTIFPGIINFAQTSHLIFVSGPFLENRVNFLGVWGKLLEGKGGCSMV